VSCVNEVDFLYEVNQQNAKALTLFDEHLQQNMSIFSL